MNMLVSAAEIQTKVSELAEKIQANEPNDTLFVALLNGAAPFAVDLMRALASKPDVYPTLRYMHTSTYGEGFKAGEVAIVSDTIGKTALGGRTIMVLDDVLDTGKTYAAVREDLIARGAAQDCIKLAVLAQKDVPRQDDIRADYVAFDLPNQWLYGGGLNGIPGADNPEAGRWLSAIYTAD